MSTDADDRAPAAVTSAMTENDDVRNDVTRIGGKDVVTSRLTDGDAADSSSLVRWTQSENNDKEHHHHQQQHRHQHADVARIGSKLSVDELRAGKTQRTRNIKQT